MDVDPSSLLTQPLPMRAEHGFDALLGLELLEASDELARGRVTVRDELRQPMGLLHGGVYATVAESLASLATARAVHGAGKMATGQSNNTSFLRPVTEGAVEAVAVRKHAGRTTWIWDVEMRDGAGRLCALSRMTIAVRDA